MKTEMTRHFFVKFSNTKFIIIIPLSVPQKAYRMTDRWIGFNGSSAGRGGGTVKKNTALTSGLIRIISITAD